MSDLVYFRNVSTVVGKKKLLPVGKDQLIFTEVISTPLYRLAGRNRESATMANSAYAKIGIFHCR